MIDGYISEDTCTPVFTASLFAIAKTWKQPNKQMIEWRSCDTHTHTYTHTHTHKMEYYWAIKNEILYLVK